MPSTRSSTRQGGGAGSSPASSQDKSAPAKASVGSKRKAESSPTQKSKRGKKGEEKEQKTIEETLESTNGKEEAKDKPVEEVVPGNEDEPMKDADAVEKRNGEGVSAAPAEQKSDEQETSTENTQNGKAEESGPGPKEQEPEAKAQPQTSNGTAVETSTQREESVPSSVLEKGVIYFFFRGRVGIEDPQDVNDIARSYIILRPIPSGAKLGEGPIGDDGNSRLIALPKKVLPKSHRDRFLAFVEKSATSFQDLKENFVAGSDYATKTAGTRHTPAATPIGEGVYAITTTGRESHLAYILTVPSEVSEVQKDMGLNQRGSFITSVKNPQYPGPAQAQLPKDPEYPKELLEEFRSLRWMPLQPKFLNYADAQFLLIGEGRGELGKATEQQPRDDKNDKDTPLEEIEKLEGEDEIRVEHLKDDDPIFADLGLSSKEYPKLQTSW